MLARVRQGALSEEAGEQADDLMLEFKKYLVRSAADQQVLELDILHASVEKREVALKKLMDLATDRENTKVDYLLRLQELGSGAGRKHATIPPPPVLPSNSAPPPATTYYQPERLWRIRDLDIEIEIAPEDISKGVHD